MNQNDHYLLTGASGFIGKVIHADLLAKGFEVMKFIGNITSPVILDESLKIDVVVHAAGKAHTLPKTATEEKRFFDINFEGTKNLCKALENLIVKPKSFVFISTVAVYGLDSGIMISEEHSLNGKTAYAKSKILAEEWLQSWAANNDIILTILRLPLVAGPNPPGNLADMINAIKGKKYFSIGKANAKKSMVWIHDIPAIIPDAAKIGGIYNLTDGVHPTFKQLELTIANKTKRRIKTIPLFIAKILAAAGDIPGVGLPINSNKLKKITSTLTFDDTKARITLLWKPSSVLKNLDEFL